jgi:SAM-dependent methyltransferase
MKQPEEWRPSKFVTVSGRTRASRDPDHVAPASRLITDRLAVAYEAALHRHARGALLDLGCGQVPLFGVYRTLVSEVTCVDWASGATLKHVDQVVDLNGPLPFPDGRFDTVLATDVLEHVRRPLPLLGEIARVLRPAGTLIAGVPFLYWIHEEPHDYYRYTEFALRHLCEEGGLAVSSVEPYGGAPEVVLDTLAKMLSHGRLGNLALGRGITAATVFLGGLWAGTALGRRLSHATARTFPLGYCLVAAKPTATAGG